MIYQRKAIMVEAVFWNGTDEAYDRLNKMGCVMTLYGNNTCLFIVNSASNSPEIAKSGDWIVKMPNGDFLTMDAKDFHENYEVAEQ